MPSHTGVNIVLLRAVRTALAAATLLAYSAQAQDPGPSDSGQQATASQATEHRNAAMHRRKSRPPSCRRSW